MQLTTDPAWVRLGVHGSARGLRALHVTLGPIGPRLGIFSCKKDKSGPGPLCLASSLSPADAEIGNDLSVTLDIIVFDIVE